MKTVHGMTEQEMALHYLETVNANIWSMIKELKSEIARPAEYRKIDYTKKFLHQHFVACKPSVNTVIEWCKPEVKEKITKKNSIPAFKMDLGGG